MGTRNSGRKRIPTALKKAHRMPSEKNVNKDEPQVPAIIHAPPAPDALHPIARAEWERVAPLMVDVGMLTELDLAPLYAYCDAFGLVHRTDAMMKKLAAEDPQTEGIVVQSPGGAAYLNPLMAVHRAAVRDMVRYAAELGLTPSGRASIIVAERGGMGKAQRRGAIQPGGADLAAKYGL